MDEASKTADASLALAPGDLIGDRCRLIQPIAEGGMGAVWRAHNVALDVPVAVKVMRPEFVRRPALVKRMVDEARAIARITHPAIVRVIDVGIHESVPYIVMELLEGESLADAQRVRGRIAPDKAVRCLLPIASALACAHGEHGIVHRDVKPENILLAETRDGGLQPKLIDFGVAKTALGGGKTVTAIGTIVGTPRYMSPEQAQGEPATHAADIWGLSIVLYELIAGQTPFESDTLGGLIDGICSRPAASLADQGLCDPALWSIIERGLAKTPRGRWETMQGLGEALALWLVSCGITHDITGTAVADAWAPRSRDKRDHFDSEPPTGPQSERWRELMQRVSPAPPASKTPIQSSNAPSSSKPPNSSVSPKSDAPRESWVQSYVSDGPTTPRHQQPHSDQNPRRRRWTEADDAAMQAAAAKKTEPRRERVTGGPRHPGGDPGGVQRSAPVAPAGRAASPSPAPFFAPGPSLFRRQGRHDTDPAPVSYPPANPAEFVKTALDAAQQAFTTGRIERAYEQAEQALEASTTPEAERLIAAHWPALERIFYGWLGGSGARIRVGKADTAQALTPTQAYIASRIDGLSVAEAVDVSGTDVRTALRMICRLRAIGLVLLRPER